MDNRAYELVEAIRGTANGASARAERFARIGPFMIEAGGGPLAGYVSARPWREGDGGTGAVLRRCAVAERAGGASGLVLFHCADRLTLPELRGFLAAARAADRRGLLAVTTAGYLTPDARGWAAGRGIAVLPLQGMDAVSIGGEVLAACASAVRSGAPPVMQTTLFGSAA